MVGSCTSVKYWEGRGAGSDEEGRLLETCGKCYSCTELCF
jgi:hypothetical protein